jgi:phosphocarrier protein HPr
MVQRTATIRNTNGIHCRPSAEIVRFAKDYPGRIKVTVGRTTTDLRSILELMSMGLAKDTPVKIEVRGADEEKFSQALVELFERRFDFPPRDASAPLPRE